MIDVSNSTLAHYEYDYRTLTLENLMRICDACDYEILFRDKEKNKFYRFNDMNVDYDIKVINK